MILVLTLMRLVVSLTALFAALWLWWDAARRNVAVEMWMQTLCAICISYLAGQFLLDTYSLFAPRLREKGSNP